MLAPLGHDALAVLGQFCKLSLAAFGELSEFPFTLGRRCEVALAALGQL